MYEKNTALPIFGLTCTPALRKFVWPVNDDDVNVDEDENDREWIYSTNERTEEQMIRRICVDVRKIMGKTENKAYRRQNSLQRNNYEKHNKKKTRLQHFYVPPTSGILLS